MRFQRMSKNNQTSFQKKGKPQFPSSKQEETQLTSLFELHRKIGNQAFGRLIQAKENSGNIHRLAGRGQRSLTARSIPVQVFAAVPSIMRAKSRHDGDEGWLAVEVPDGPYVLEAVNIEADVSSDFSYTKGFQYYNQAWISDPFFINAIDAFPFKGRSDSNNVDADFKVVAKAPESSPKPWTKGKLSINVYLKRPGYISDYDTLFALVKVDIVPFISKVTGPNKLIHGKAIDMNPARWTGFHTEEGASVGRSVEYSREVTDGYTLSRGRKVTNELSSEISSEIGSDIKVLSAKVGSKISAKTSVENSVGETTAKSVKGTHTVKDSVTTGTKPGDWVIVPTARIISTPVVINQFDAKTGLLTSTENTEIITVIYNELPSVYPATSRGEPITKP